MVNVGYHKFSVDGDFYFYDTTSNGLFQIDETVYHALDDSKLRDLERLRLTITNGTFENQIIHATRSVKQPGRQHSILQPFFQKDFSSYVDREFINAHIQTNMRRLMLNVTDQCNQRCKYCFFSGDYFSYRAHNEKYMTWRIAKASIDLFLQRTKKTKRPMIAFYGGEPLLNWPLIEKCIKYVREKSRDGRLAVFIFTNGTLLTERVINYLMAKDVTIWISLDGPVDAHDAARVYRNGKGTHKKVIQSLKRIQRNSQDYLRKRVLISCTYNKNDNIVRLFRYFSHDNFRHLFVRPRAIRDFDTDLHTVTGETHRKFEKDLSALINTYLEYLQSGQQFNYTFIQNTFGRIFKGLPKREIGPARTETRPNRTCIPGVSQLFVGSDGVFHLCDNFCPPGYDIGNYKTGIEIAKVQRLLESYVQTCEDMCQSCWAYRLCSLCFVHTLENSHLSKKRKVVNCVREKQRISNDLKGYIYILKNEPATAFDHRFTLNALVQKEQSRKKRKDSKTFPSVKLKRLPRSIGVTRNEIKSALSDLR